MAFKLQTVTMQPGSLNLLTPADNPPELESVDLTDWWPSAEGKLEQAPAPQVLTSEGYVDSLMKAGANRYSAGEGSVYLNGAALDGGYGSAYPVGMISFQGYAWFTSQLKQAKYDGSTLTPWTTPAPATMPDLADLGQFTGKKVWPLEDSYCYTWVIPGIGETNPSPPQQLTVGATGDVEGHAIQISLPTGAAPPTGATGWNIYRRVPGYGGSVTPNLDANSIFYLLNTDAPIPLSQTTYKDTGDEIDGQDDTALLTFGQILEANHDAAPAAAIVANQTFNGRIIVANSAAHPNRMWWTPALQPGFFRGSADDIGGDWVDVGTDSTDEIRAIIVRPGLLVIYRAKSIWRQLGDFDDANVLLEVACPDVGIAGARAIASTAAADYFVSAGGDALYSYNNDWPTKLSQRIEPLLRGLPSENYGAQNTGAANLCAVGHRRGRLYVSYTPQAPPYDTFILHLESGRWFSCSTLFRCFLDAGDVFLGGGLTGTYQLEAAFSSSSALSYQSQYQDCGAPDHEKTWADLVISGETQGLNLNVIVRTNKNANPAYDEMNLGSLNVSKQQKQILPLLYPSGYPNPLLANQPIRAYNLAVRITGAGFSGGVPIQLDSPILLHYYLEARRAKFFDSGITTHGLDGAGRLDQVELDIDTSAGPAGLVIWTDLPGGVLEDRTSRVPGSGPTIPVTIPQTTGRQVLRLLLLSPVSPYPPFPIWGRLFRHQIGSATNFQLYGYRVRVLPIGVYLDGSNPVGEWYDTQPITPGI